MSALRIVIAIFGCVSVAAGLAFVGLLIADLIAGRLDDRHDASTTDKGQQP